LIVVNKRGAENGDADDEDSSRWSEELERVVGKKELEGDAAVKFYW
jgi:hypothetical protein